jgi:branched-chain amino acid transport system substrate-binding protein
MAHATNKAGTDPEKLRKAIEQTRGCLDISSIYNLTPEDHKGLDPNSMIMVRI